MTKFDKHTNLESKRRLKMESYFNLNNPIYEIHRKNGTQHNIRVSILPEYIFDWLTYDYRVNQEYTAQDFLNDRGLI